MSAVESGVTTPSDYQPRRWFVISVRAKKQRAAAHVHAAARCRYCCCLNLPLEIRHGDRVTIHQPQNMQVVSAVEDRAAADHRAENRTAGRAETHPARASGGHDGIQPCRSAFDTDRLEGDRGLWNFWWSGEMR